MAGSLFRKFVHFFGMYHILRKWIMDDLAKTPEEIAQIMYDMIAKNGVNV